MAISLRHQFTSPKTDGSDSTLVQPSNWNEEHVLTQATARLLGRTSAGAGPTEEISVGGNLSLSAGVLNLGSSVSVTALTATGAITGGSVSTQELTVTGTGAIRVSVGDTSERPVGAAGDFRFNSQTGKFEGYDGVEWGSVGGGGGFFRGENGAVGDPATGPGDIFRVNEQTLNTDVTIGATENASCAGPLTIASGVTLTVTSGGNLSVV